MNQGRDVGLISVICSWLHKSHVPSVSPNHAQMKTTCTVMTGKENKVVHLAT